MSCAGRIPTAPLDPRDIAAVAVRADHRGFGNLCRLIIAIQTFKFDVHKLTTPQPLPVRIDSNSMTIAMQLRRFTGNVGFGRIGFRKPSSRLSAMMPTICSHESELG
jgi:hypothetical protein